MSVVNASYKFVDVVSFTIWEAAGLYIIHYIYVLVSLMCLSFAFVLLLVLLFLQERWSP